MSDAVNRGRALLVRMERTDQVSFYGARVVIRDLCDAVEALEAELENTRAMGEAAYSADS